MCHYSTEIMTTSIKGPIPLSWQAVLERAQVSALPYSKYS